METGELMDPYGTPGHPERSACHALRNGHLAFTPFAEEPGSCVLSPVRRATVRGIGQRVWCMVRAPSARQFPLSHFGHPLPSCTVVAGEPRRLSAPGPICQRAAAG